MNDKFLLSVTPLTRPEATLFPSDGERAGSGAFMETAQSSIATFQWDSRRWLRLVWVTIALSIPSLAWGQFYGPGKFHHVEFIISTWTSGTGEKKDTIVVNDPQATLTITGSKFPNGQSFDSALRFTGTLKLNYPSVTPPTDPKTFLFNPPMSASLDLSGTWTSDRPFVARGLLSNPHVNAVACAHPAQVIVGPSASTSLSMSIHSECDQIKSLNGGLASDNPKETLLFAGSLMTLDDGRFGSVGAGVNIRVIYKATLRPQIGLSPTVLNFDYTTLQPAPPARTLTLTNPGGQTLTWTAKATTKSGGDWLKVNPASGSLDQDKDSKLEVSIDPVPLSAAGDYEGAITVDGDASTGPKSAIVRLKVTKGREKGTLVVKPSSLEFFNTVTFPQQEVTLSNPGAKPLVYLVNRSTVTGGDWLFKRGSESGTVAPGASVTATILALGKLGVGDYEGKLSFVASASPDAVDFPTVDVPVIFHVIELKDEVTINSAAIIPGNSKPLKQGTKQGFSAVVNYTLMSRGDADLALRVFDDQGNLQGSSDFKRATKDGSGKALQMVIDPFLITTNSTGKFPEKLLLRAVLIDRTLAKVFATTPDIAYELEPKAELLALEVIQVVQNWNNSVPLFEGKRTHVRAHIQAKGDAQVEIDNGVLHGFRNGRKLAGSPMRPLNPGGKINAPNDVLSDPKKRADLDRTLNFGLSEKEWLSGNVTLVFEALGVSCGNTVDPSCQINVTFKPAPNLEVKFINIRWSARGDPDTHEATALDIKEQAWRILSIYPLAEAWKDYSDVRHTWTFGIPLTFENILKEVADYRDNDSCDSSCRRLYFGLVADLPALTEGGEVGMAYLGSTVGAAGVGGTSLGSSRHVVGHEIGHSLGLDHAVDSSLGLIRNANGNEVTQGWCSESGEKDAENFPYSVTIEGKKYASLGPMDKGDSELVFGLDTSSSPIEVVSPWVNFELMSYCRGLVNEFKWPSRHSYEKIANVLQSRFAASHAQLLAPVAKGNYLMISGSVDLERQTAEFRPFAMLFDANPPASPAPGPYELQLQDVTGTVLQVMQFELLIPRQDGIGRASTEGHFSIPVPFDGAFKKAVLLHNGNVLASRQASVAAPVVQVLSPNGGENALADPLLVKWKGTDADGDTLMYNLQISFDGGTTWEAVAVNLAAESYEIPQRQLRATALGLIRVIARDGFNAAMDVSDAVFIVPNHAPVVVIRGPAANYLFTGPQVVVFEADARDQDNPRSEVDVQWTSDRDGILGKGAVLQRSAGTLAEGKHVITATVNDSTESVSTASVNISVVRAVPNNLADLKVLRLTLPAQVTAGDTISYTVTVANHGPNLAANVKLTNTLPEGVTFVSVTPATLNFLQTGRQVVCTLGPMGSAATTNVTYVVVPQTAAQIVLVASVGGEGVDPNPNNNVVTNVLTVKAPANTVSISASLQAGQLQLSWPVSAGGFILQSAHSLAAPVKWQPVNAPINSNLGQNTVTVPVSGGVRFYRLAKP